MPAYPSQQTQAGQFATFGGVSVVTTLVDFGLFNLLLATGVARVVVANTVSYGAGIVASYALNKRLTFAGRGRDVRSHEIALFVLFNVGGLALNNAAVAAAAWAAADSTVVLNLAKLGAGVAIWLFKFLAFARWVYPTPSPKEPG